MPTFPRDEVADTVTRFEQANQRSEARADWSELADFYTDDAVYT